MANDTAQQLKAWIEAKLGGESVQVEVGPKAIEAAIKDAFEWWAAYKGFCREDSLNVVSGQTSYDLSAHDPEILQIVRIWWPLRPGQDFVDLWTGFLDLSGVPYGQYPFQQGGVGVYSSLVQYFQQYETAARVLSIDRDFIFNSETKELILTPALQVSGTAVYLYSTPFKPEYLGYISPRDMMLIRRRALAEVKETLGYVRGKYESGLPAAQGSVNLDGGTLRSEAQSEKAQLDELILSLVPPALPVVG